MSYTITFGNKKNLQSMCCANCCNCQNKSIQFNQSDQSNQSNQSNQQSNMIPIIYDSYEVAQEFCNLFYQGMSTNGCADVLNLFDQNASCVYDEKEYVGFYNVMTAMASQGIHKTIYDNLNCTVLPVNNEQISLQITGNIKGITFWGQSSMIYKFIDTFIITIKNESNFAVTSYSNKLL